MTNWQPEADEEWPETPQYQIKAHVALEDSDTQSWGITKDVEGNFLWKPGDGSIVGTWSRSPVDGLVHVFLETPLAALIDKATLRFAEYAERRRTIAPTKTPRTKTPKPQREPVGVSEDLTAISNLRKLLGK